MDQIERLLTRGVDKIYPSRAELEKLLRSGRKIKLYQGFDPTGTKLHIGHAVGFRKLRQWQDLGHEVIFLIGDGTGLAGDPSGKMKARGRFMSHAELRDNAKAYLMQAAKIVDFEGPNPVKIVFNGDWLTELKLEEILNIAQNFSLQQMIERDMYQERLKAGDSINLREFLYPLLQGYDSVALKVDLELGGSDQTFNMLAGRTLVKNMLGREKFVMTVPLLTDSNNVKIGKTEGNVIGLTDPAGEFYAKIMALGDDAIIPCFDLLTDLDTTQISQMSQQIKQGINPMIYKKQLAFAITKWLHDETAARTAQREFEEVHQKQSYSQLETQTLELNSQISKNSKSLLEALVAGGFIKSKSEAKRLSEAGAIRIFSHQNDTEKSVEVMENNDIIRIGPKKFIRIKFN